jgi:Protein of unknown function (DUF3768)
LQFDASSWGVDSETEEFMLASTENGGTAKSHRIRDLNDALRKTHAGGRVYLTSGVNALPSSERTTVIQKVRDFAEFTADNDPHGEHDFGSFDHAGRKLFWKIDYYARDMDGGSEDPSNPAMTRRVLTIMFAEEY